MRILIADDDEITRKIICSFLKGSEHAVVEVEDGKQALKKLRGREQFDLLITDIVMPEMDGRDLVKVLRGSKSEKLRKLPVVMTSGQIRCMEIYDLLEIGVTWFLAKPVEKEEFMELVDKIAKLLK